MHADYVYFISFSYIYSHQNYISYSICLVLVFFLFFVFSFLVALCTSTSELTCQVPMNMSCRKIPMNSILIKSRNLEVPCEKWGKSSSEGIDGFCGSTTTGQQCSHNQNFGTYFRIKSNTNDLQCSPWNACSTRTNCR